VGGVMSVLGYSIAGLVVGTAVGATGVGGGSLMTPILILFYGVSPTLAVGTDLIYASISKSWGTWLHNRNQSVDWRIVGWQALGSIPAALLTLMMLSRIHDIHKIDSLIKLVLSSAIVTTALFTLFQDRVMVFVRNGHGGTAASAAQEPRFQRLLTVLAGILIGSLVTISSVGAGAIGMMLLLLLYPKHEAVSIVGSDLAHAVLITAIAGFGHARLGGVDYALLGTLLLGAIPGIWLGSRIGFRLRPRVLKRVISVLLLLVGGMTLCRVL
jgi:uncharacterized membrane protein YfcA